MAWREDPARCRLAEEAARRAAAGLEAGPVLAGLRRLTTAGLLADGPAPRRSQDLAGIARAVCGPAGCTRWCPRTTCCRWPCTAPPAGR